MKNLSPEQQKIEKRRELVRALDNDGLQQIEIVNKLREIYGIEVSQQTISLDLRAIRHDDRVRLDNEHQELAYFHRKALDRLEKIYKAINKDLEETKDVRTRAGLYRDTINVILESYKLHTGSDILLATVRNSERLAKEVEDNARKAREAVDTLSSSSVVGSVGSSSSIEEEEERRKRGEEEVALESYGAVGSVGSSGSSVATFTTLEGEGVVVDDSGEGDDDGAGSGGGGGGAVVGEGAVVVVGSSSVVEEEEEEEEENNLKSKSKIESTGDTNTLPPLSNTSSSSSSIEQGHNENTSEEGIP